MKSILKIKDQYSKRLINLKEKYTQSFPTTQQERTERLKLSNQIRIITNIINLLNTFVDKPDKILAYLQSSIQNTSDTNLRNELKGLQKKISSELIDESDYIGITELSDPALNLSWIPRLRPKANIIITKNVEAIAPTLLKEKQRIILHATCTGLGGTIWEPNVPPAPIQIKAVENLINSGFPVKQIVHRLDPIILDTTTVKAHMLALQYFSDLGITRVRYSFCDFYPTVKDRFRRAGLIFPENTFSYSQKSMETFRNEMIKKFPHMTFESCAENLIDSIGCISNKDLEILGVKSIELIGSKGTRRGCKCPLNKFELIRDVPGKCKHNCIYCFWKKDF